MFISVKLPYGFELENRMPLFPVSKIVSFLKRKLVLFTFTKVPKDDSSIPQLTERKISVLTLFN